MERYKFPIFNLIPILKKSFAFIEPKIAKSVIEECFNSFLGGKNEAELLEEKMRSEFDELKKRSKDKKTFSEADNKRMEELRVALKKIEDDFQKLKDSKKETKAIANNTEKQENTTSTNGAEEEPENAEKDKLSTLIARDMKSAMNTPHILEKHLKETGGKVHTRFPPEPNGYLHIGHAKAMRFSFTSAAQAGGNCYLRFDDTNPEKETKEFIDNIKENVEWLGYKPWKITFASDQFENLYELAKELIRKGKAYVCHQTKQEMNEYRDKKMDSPYRNRSVEENLKLFEMMRQGRFDEKECCLRMKIDMKHNNPCMRDPVAYRIKYAPHPHAGDKWCIYPTYDYTHCLNDSLENITHSLCTLEFEIRRDSYYWLLEALDMYRPFVWEYSRLNLTKIAMSKRKLTELVTKKIVRGWDDPRLPTINGLRRRGYTAEAINNFVDTVGVTRRGNENFLSIKLLEHCIRTDLDRKAPRTLSVLDPLKITFVNLPDDYKLEIETPLFPKNKELGTRKVFLSKSIYIERSDFKFVENTNQNANLKNNKKAKADEDDFFGLMPHQEVGIKYTGIIKYKDCIRNEKGEITELLCEFDSESKKTKGRIHWISTQDAQRVEFRLYDYLFKSDNPMALKEPLDDLNPKSLTIRTDSVVNKAILNGIKAFDHFQFERLGYFVCDLDTNPSLGRYVFNLTVDLGDEKLKLIK